MLTPDRCEALLAHKWEASETCPNSITGQWEEGSHYIVSAPQPLREVLVQMQNCLSDQYQSLCAREASLLEKHKAVDALLGIQRKKPPLTESQICVD